MAAKFVSCVAGSLSKKFGQLWLGVHGRGDGVWRRGPWEFNSRCLTKCPSLGGRSSANKEQV